MLAVFLLLSAGLVHAAERGQPGQFRRSAVTRLTDVAAPNPLAPRRTPGPPRALEHDGEREALAKVLSTGAHLWAKPPMRDVGTGGAAGPPAKIATLFAAQARSDYPIGPPDTTGAVGKDRLITGTNIAISVHDRSGKTLKTADINEFWAPLAGDSSYCGDPRFVYDPLADRFYSVVMAINYQDSSVRLLLANTVTNDPAGEWHQVDLPLPATHSIDQPLLGFSANRVVVQANDFVGSLDKLTGAAVRTRIFSIDKADLLAGGKGKLVSWAEQTMGLSNAPAQTWDPQVTDGYLVSSSGSAALRLLRITGPLGDEQLESVASWSTEAGGAMYLNGSNIGPQLGSDVAIDVGDGRTHDAILRNGSLWFTFSLFAHNPSPVHAVVVWQQVSLSGEVLQDGVIAGDSSLSHSSLAPDAKGNVLVGFSQTNPEGFASAAFAYHRADMAPGTTLPVQTVVAGRGQYDLQFQPWGNRWGDYSATVIDPQNDHLWTVQEYALTPDGNGQGVWGVAWAEVTPDTPTCSSDADCPTLQYCADGLCTADLIPGTVCSNTATCATGLCLKGVCCAESCSGDCRRCLPLSLAESGATPGICASASAKSTCDDGDPCTAQSMCSGSKCIKVGISCDDGNPCTADVCGASGCSHTPLSTPCSDGSVCTVGDQCVAGACKAGPAKACHPDTGLCQVGGTCHPVNGCQFAKAADGTGCGDGYCSDGECTVPLGGRVATGCASGQGAAWPPLMLVLLALGGLRLRRRRS